MKTRDGIVDYTDKLVGLTGIKRNEILKEIGITLSKYYEWKRRYGIPNSHNSNSTRDHWLTEEEELRIIEYAKSHTGEGYRRLTYMMIDENVAFVSPSSVYRILYSYGLLNKWENDSNSKKGEGFDQPIKSMNIGT